MEKQIIIKFQSVMTPMGKDMFLQNLANIEVYSPSIKHPHEMLQSLSVILIEMLKKQINSHKINLPDCKCKEITLFQETLDGMTAAYNKITSLAAN